MAAKAPITFLPGFRFRPTDQILLGHYLPSKIMGQALDPRLAGSIMEADLYGANDPEKVYAQFNISEYDCLNAEFFFFTFVRKKSSTGRGNHMDRIAGKGTWKCQHPKPVYDEISGALMGHKTTLNFQINNKNINPSWIMHEYTLPNTESCDHWAICRVKRRHRGKDNASMLDLPVYSTNKRPLSSSSAQNLDPDAVQYHHHVKKQCSSVASGYELGSSWQPSLRPPSPPPASHCQTLAPQPTDVPPNGTTCLSQDEGLLCSSTEPTNLTQPTQLSTSSTECLAESLNQYLTCGVPEESSTFPENDLFTLDELLLDYESNNSFALEALNFDTCRMPELQNSFIEMESYGGIVLS